MSNIQTYQSTTGPTTEVVQKKYDKFKTLVLKLKGNHRQTDFSSLTPDQLDEFVDETITDIEKTLLSHVNHLRERIKQIRPHPNDPHYHGKMIVYQDLLQQIILIMQIFQHVINRTLNELHFLVQQLWNDIANNHGNNIETLLTEHANRTNAFMNDMWIKHVNVIEATLNALN